MSAATTLLVVSASRTEDGAPVYLTPDLRWSRAVADALIVEDGAAQKEELLDRARGEEREVCDPYTLKVTREDGRAVPLTARERIRSTGPTTPIRRPDRRAPIRRSA